jgi:uncharacterized protein
VFVVPDPRRRAPGRGAWLHRDPQCVALAERRRAFGRALRVSGAIDPRPVREYVAEHPAVLSNTEEIVPGREQKSYGHSMKRQQ